MVQKSHKEKIELKATPRTIIGKANKSLRKSGVIPANIFGKDFPSAAVSLDYKEFTDTFKKAGETNVVYIKLGDKDIPTLIGEIQSHPITQSILHVDLRKINLKQKIEAQVPVVITGTSGAVEQKHGILLTQMDEVTVEALPANIPNEIEVDITPLLEIGDLIHISDLPKSEEYEIKEEPEKIVVSVTEHKEEELEPETVSEEPEIIGEAEKEEAGEASESSEAPQDKKEESK